MRTLKLLALLSLALLVAPHAQAAEIGIGIHIGGAYVGPAPVCPYGYYPDYPYACAPDGYYGPEWFSGGVFIGAGPWFHGYPVHRDFDARRGFVPGPAVRDRGDFHRFAPAAPRGEFHGDVNRGQGARSNGRENFRGGNNFHGSGRR